MLTQDDTKEFTCEEIIPEKSSVMGLVGCPSLKMAGTLALYNVAPLIICFLGLARYEMPHNSFIFWGVEGLYVGGYGVGGSKEVRYVLFMRKCPGS